MEFRLLSEEEFIGFSNKHKLGSFYQTKEWGLLKQLNGWVVYYAGVVNNKDVLASSLILKKNLFGNISLMYAPRGFLLDYENKELLTKFVEGIKSFAKSHHSIFVKIDPVIINKERDINGDIVEGGIDNENIINNLLDLGFKKSKSHLQPMWTFVLSLKDDIESNFNNRVKRSLKKCNNVGITVKEIDIKNIEVYKDIMKHTSNRRGFIDRPLSYYENMKKIMKDKCIILVAYLNKKTAIDSINNEIEQLNKNISSLNPNNKKYDELLSNHEKSLNNKRNELNKLNNLNNDEIPLSGALFMLHNKEMLYLFGGSYSEYMEYPSQYIVQYEAILKAQKLKCNRFNFYGIDGFNTDKDMKGIYEFKRGFSGNVEEYIGEYNLVTNKLLYFAYSFLYQKVYVGIKNMKLKK